MIVAARAVYLAVVCVALGGMPWTYAVEGQRQRFTAPEVAVQTLLEAIQKNSTEALLAIFGADEKALVFSGDEVADRAERDRFVAMFQDSHRLEYDNPETIVLHVGSEDWPFPIPLVKADDQWVFDTAAGKEEILNRRIGRNELQAIQVLSAYVDAQREYRAMDRDGDHVHEYAQRLVSTPGTKDGLYWEAAAGEPMSPFGPLVAQAAEEGYTPHVSGEAQAAPYQGYFYKILKRQGPQAPGGEYDYMINGNMLLGFALVAYPADYGASGIMTFLVNHTDVIYEKELGECTDDIVKVMSQFNPDDTWKKVE
jgi:hypothetical protein